jgi:hypothetical protein
MKAILVIDEMPTKCEECPCSTILTEIYGEDVFTCDAVRCGDQEIKEEHMVSQKPWWCPLKPMPEEFTVESLSEEKQGITKLVLNLATMKVFADGYNACLEEINK